MLVLQHDGSLWLGYQATRARYGVMLHAGPYGFILQAER